MNAMEQARLWFDNITTMEQWRADYGRRTGKTRAEIIEEQRSFEIHDERAFVVGKFDGFTMSGIEMRPGTYRYTVRTPWDVNEGLIDTEGRDDGVAFDFFADVVSEFSRLRDGSHESEPTETSRNEKPKSKPIKAPSRVTAAKTATKVSHGRSRRNCVMPKRVPDAASIAKFGRKLASMSECPVCRG